VIHYSSYEEPYLHHLHKDCAQKQTFPFSFICTHKIVSRLYPGLPRKGLRAAAGFFGYALPNLRRSLHHAVATAFIWNHVVQILEEKERITTLEELNDWLRTSSPSMHSIPHEREYPMEKSQRQNLPERPGIYRMYRSTGDLLYIGKAKSLKHRVNSYFHKRGRHAEHILEMLSQAHNLSTTVTQTALEAAVRESDEIKTFSPPYNRALQPNERQLYYYSKDLKVKNSRADIRFPIGPIPSNIEIGSLAQFIDSLNNNTKKFTPGGIASLLDCLPEYAPELDCFLFGFEEFEQEYFAPIEKPITLSHMMKWGTLYWKEKLLEKDSDNAEEEEAGQTSEELEKSEEGWTPERVFRTLKRKIRLHSFQMRRARWFCRLSESCLAWSGANGAESKKNTLLIINGKAHSLDNDTPSDNPSIPPGHRQTLFERQANFDIATYDRMRVVTTEMRRLIQEGRDIALSFHPGQNLTKKQLDKILKWV
jgi:DNA polymerase-3 subunit epsilon